MPLQRETLQKKLYEAFQRIHKIKDHGGPPPPLMPLKVATELATAYHDWVMASTPVAGALTIVMPGQSVVIAAALSAAPLMQGWAPGLLAYWSTVVWGNNPTFVPSNPTIPAAISGVAPEIVILMTPPPKVETEDEFSDALASILHSYTVKMQVAATTVAGVASIVPIT